MMFKKLWMKIKSLWTKPTEVVAEEKKEEVKSKPKLKAIPKKVAAKKKPARKRNIAKK